MATFRPYTTQEIRDAAEAYGVDPAFALAIYERESSNGTNPNAMKARSVKRKRDTTIVRGPFQLEDGTASDLIRKNKLGNVNVDDPDAHLDLAMRLMRELSDRYNGDPVKMAKAYLGGPGGVTNNTKDELGTSTSAYANDIVAAMQRLKGDTAAPVALDTDIAELTNLDDLGSLMPDKATPFNSGAMMPADDMFGIPEMPAMAQGIERDPLGLPMFLSGGRKPAASVNIEDDNELRDYVAALVDDEFQGKDFAHA
jgi:hypothetical protein